jgi:hypothetical protein
VLETNIYSKASDDPKSFDLASREISPFRFLVNAIRPKVIVVHDKPAVEAIAKFTVPSAVIAADHHFRVRRSGDGQLSRSSRPKPASPLTTPIRTWASAVRASWEMISHRRLWGRLWTVRFCP